MQGYQKRWVGGRRFLPHDQTTGKHLFQSSDDEAFGGLIGLGYQIEGTGLGTDAAGFEVAKARQYLPLASFA